MSWFSNIFKRKPAARREAFIKQQEGIDTPWAAFEIVGFDENSQIKVEFNWNDAFIKQLDKLGFTAETPQDTVQLFFYASQMKPTELDGGDRTVNPQEMPNLSGNSNRMVT